MSPPPPPPQTLEPGAAVVCVADALSFTPKPLIDDILRTEKCVPGSVFLVEGIDASIDVTSRYRAVRLQLGDDELCIQALLSGEMHDLVDAGTVYDGCYVRLDKFDLRFFGLDGPNKMAYLVVQSLATVGWNTAYLDIIERDRARPASGDGGVEAPTTEAAEPGEEEHQAATKRLEVDDEVFDSDLEEDFNFEVMDVSPMKTTQRRQAVDKPPAAHQPATTPSSTLPWLSTDPTKPLKLTLLGSIPNLPYKQNWTVNILAVVTSLSPVEPSNLLPHFQRIARLADPSTSKQVHLTVFLNPEGFTPKVGSVVLLLGLKNHRFDGGSLKKYANDLPAREGSRWWFEEPVDLEWCGVVAMRRWWDGRDRG